MIYDNGRDDKKYEHCECSEQSTKTEGDFCKPFCNNDIDCKGYEYDDVSCTIYTTSTCPTECEKRNVGITGNMVPTYQGDLLGNGYGCFSKVRC